MSGPWDPDPQDRRPFPDADPDPAWPARDFEASGVDAVDAGWRDPPGSSWHDGHLAMSDDDPTPGSADELGDEPGDEPADGTSAMLRASAAPVQTALVDGEPDEAWDGRSDRRQPTTAEQAVPWLIGVILLLTGMVIVLLALIFTSDNGLMSNPGASSGASPGVAGASASPTADATPGSSVVAVPSGSAAPSQPAVEATPAATATPPPTYGALEMVYLGRSAALEPIYLLRQDFTDEGAATVLAQDPTNNVQRFAWAWDGTHGAAIIAGRLVSVEPGGEARPLAEPISAITFSPDGATVYAVRIEQVGADDRATMLAIDYASGESRDLASVTYPRPVVGAEQPLIEAQFADDGGLVRIFQMADGNLRLWILGAPMQEIDPGDGSIRALGSDAKPPVLWSPAGMQRMEITESGGTTTLTLHDRDDTAGATTTVSGLVSHLRWAPDGSQVVFTLGSSTGANGVLQDLFMWDLGAGSAPVKITPSGAAFGAEWLGAAESWRP